VLVAVVTVADTDRTVRALTAALGASIERHRGAPRPVVGAASYGVDPVVAVPPRAAFFARAEAVTIAAAAGRVSAEVVAPYPPGIPVIAPGEQITADVLAALEHAQRAGVRIAYAADPTLATLRVLESGAASG
jgi:lysine decarboxylase